MSEFPCLARADYQDGTPITPSPNAPLPNDIQWMPPGMQRVSPSVGGKVTPMIIRVDANLAAKLNTQLQEMRAAASQGRGDMPYIDFNHDDAEAAGEAVLMYWGGDDPVTGGIRLMVKWTDAGAAALNGKMYRRFSPSWLPGEDNVPAALFENVGGLVNRAAFTNIQPIVAKADPTTTPNETMTQDDHEKIARTIGASIHSAMSAMTDKIKKIKPAENGYGTHDEFEQETEAARAKGARVLEAAREVCWRRPDLYEAYRNRTVFGGRSKKNG